MTTDTNYRLAKWLVGNGVGMSSTTLAARMLAGQPLGFAPKIAHPHDWDDFGRCRNLLAVIPEWRERTGEMADVSAEWAGLVSHWSELDDLWYRGRVKEFYAIFRPALKENLI